MSAPPRPPRFPEVLIRPSIAMPMRDGVELATDVYLPAADGRIPGDPLPVLLRRTPYNKGPANDPEAMLLARHGYAVAVQDTRGRYASPGDFECFVDEATDGYDAIEWLATQSFCDGRIGTYGGSYSAHTQAAAAALSPPHLAAMAHYFGYPHAFWSARQGGTLDQFWQTYHVMMAGDSREARTDPNVRATLNGMIAQDWLARWPLRPGRSPLALAPSYEKSYFDFLEHEALDGYWRQPALSASDYLESWPDVPTLWICGWFDHYPYDRPETLVWERARQLGRSHHVVWGPWTHGDTGRKIGQATFGRASWREEAIPELNLRWFDRVFKGIDDAGNCPAPARYFLMGGGSGQKASDGLLEHGGEWRTAESWPPPAAERVQYLHPGGRLRAEPATAADASSTLRVDPEDPAPTSTGICYTVTRLESGGTRRVNTPGAWDQVAGPHLYDATPPFLPLAARSDYLVFETEPLVEDVIVAGQGVVELHVAVDAPDGDLVAKLIDVYPASTDYPAGIALGVSEGIQRLKFRDSPSAPTLLEPGKTYSVRVHLRAVANVFKAGHRLRLDLTGSSWPHIDTNTHTGRNPSADHERRVAHHTIRHDNAHRSRLILPVLEH